MSYFFDHAYIFWIFITLILFSFEVFLSVEYYLLCLAISSLCVSLITLLFNINWQWQIVLFSIFSVFFVYLLFLNRKKFKVADNNLNQKSLDLVGKSFFAYQDISPGQNGSLKIGDTTWRASSVQKIIKGDLVKVVKINSIILEVEKI